jgi:hypothetical protein
MEGEWSADLRAITNPMNRVAGATRWVAAWEVEEVMPDYKRAGGRRLKSPRD